jgi:hypothetical protein
VTTKKSKTSKKKTSKKASSTKKKLPTYQETYKKYNDGSSIVVHAIDPEPYTHQDETQLRCKRLHIKIMGKAAAVPSLKNAKIKGTNIVNPRVRARLQVMTDLYNTVAKDVYHFGDTELFALILCSYRGRSFDEDNAMTTIKDWLESPLIRGKNRGWGVGLTENDKYVNAYARKQKKGEQGSDCTHIILTPAEYIEHDIKELMNKLTGGLDV